MSSKVINLWQKNNENENWFWEVPIILLFHICKNQGQSGTQNNILSWFCLNKYQKGRCNYWCYLQTSQYGLKFNDIYHNPLLDKISKESISIFLLVDFNVDLLKYDHYAPTNELLDSLSSHMFLPHIMQPNRVTSNSKMLIDNIFSIILGPDSVYGNLTATVSDHLSQLVIASNIFSNSPSSRKSNIFKRDWSSFDQ